MKKKLSFFKKLQFFDYLVAGFFLLLAGAFFIFFFRKGRYLTVRVKVTERNVLYASSTPPSWFVYLFKKGMKEKDGLGRLSAEITDVYFYDSKINKKAVYLTLKLRTTYNRRTGEYKYKGIPVVVGEGLRINFEKILVEGLIVEVEGLKNPYEEVYFKVKVQLQEKNQVFSETTGVDPFVAEAIKVGDKVFDSKGEVVAEVLTKEIYPAKKNTFDARGNVYQKTDPRLKDVFLTLRIKAKKIHNEFYFLDDIRLKVNSVIPLHFRNLSIWPIITEISKID